ncbi:HPr family phosphocarrier protein [Mycoplasmatota bacterium WC44]
MKEKQFIIKDEMGLHARPASLLVNEAVKYKSEIQLISKENSVNLKSIMMVMSLGLQKGESFIISITGEDEDIAMDSINKIIEEEKIA